MGLVTRGSTQTTWVESGEMALTRRQSGSCREKWGTMSGKGELKLDSSLSITLMPNPSPRSLQAAHTRTHLHQTLLGFLLKCSFQGPTPDKGNSIILGVVSESVILDHFPGN